MPEGPEIRRAADEIAKVIEGKTIESIEVGLPHLVKPAEKLTGKKVEQVETRGKAMLIHFDNQLTVYSHNQLYGVWKTSKRGVLPKTKRSLRLALHTKDKSALLYSASDIAVYERGELNEHPFLKRLGPDILHSNTTWQMLRKQLLAKNFCNRGLSALYLDQHFIAGIGNYLRSEILFAAGIHPDRKPKQLTKAQLASLAKQTLIVAQRAYVSKGHTTPDALAKTLAKSKGAYENVRFMVFNREEQSCRLCVTPIIKAQRNGRRIYWCPQCQPMTSNQSE